MAVFDLLADPAGYVPCSTENMLVDDEYRNYWLDHFEHHFETVMKLAVDNYGADAGERAAACRRDFVAMLRGIRANPQAMGRLDLLVLDVLRQEQLIAHGLPDPFEKTKRRENRACLEQYGKIVGELDSHTEAREALVRAVEGIFAGNIFDLGAGATTKMFAEKSPDFLSVREGLKRGGGRKWLVDDFDGFADALFGAGGGGRFKKVLFFCDNAGSDIVLGVIPFCRLLAGMGVKAVIAANRLPALNDITAAELRELLPELQRGDRVLDEHVQAGRISVVDSGGVAPLIDLTQVSEEVNAAATDCDLCILEGMGRGIETNFEARFKVAAVKIAMIKEEIVARRHGGRVFDTVLRFDP